jgi:hypothetical protein
MGIKEKLAIYAGKAAGGVKNMAGRAVDYADTAADKAGDSYEKYKNDRQWKKMVKEEEASVKRERAEDAALGKEHKRWVGDSKDEYGRTKTNQQMREEIAAAKLRDETVRARELRAGRKHVRNEETRASLNRRVEKLEKRRGSGPRSTNPAGINQPGVMDVLEGRAGPGQSLDDVGKRLKGFF